MTTYLPVSSWKWSTTCTTRRCRSVRQKTRLDREPGLVARVEEPFDRNGKAHARGRGRGRPRPCLRPRSPRASRTARAVRCRTAGPRRSPVPSRRESSVACCRFACGSLPPQTDDGRHARECGRSWPRCAALERHADGTRRPPQMRKKPAQGITSARLLWCGTSLVTQRSAPSPTRASTHWSEISSSVP